MKKKATKKLEIRGKVMFTPDPERALFEFKDGDYGYNVPLEVAGAKPGDRVRLCLCYDSRVLADGVFADPATGEWVTDKTKTLKRGDVVHATASDYSTPKEKHFDKEGKPVQYHNYWISSARQVKVLSGEATRPRPRVDKPASLRPRG